MTRERLSWVALLLLLVIGACNSIVVHAFDFEPRMPDEARRRECVATGSLWPDAENALRDKLRLALGAVPFHAVPVRDPDDAFEYGHAGVDEVLAFMASDAGYVIVERGTTSSMFCIEVIHNLGGTLLVPHLVVTTAQ